MIKAVGVLSLTDQFSKIVRLLPAYRRIDSQLTIIDTPSIAVANYNVQHTVISNKHLPIDPLLPAYGRIVSQPTSTDKKVSILPNTFGRFESLLNLLQRSTVDPFLPAYGRLDPQLTSLNQIYHYFGNFSQSTACNAIRFGECSLTSLDKLWYTYAYIYKPTTEVVNEDNVLESPTRTDIRYDFESLHATCQYISIIGYFDTYYSFDFNSFMHYK